MSNLETTSFVYTIAEVLEIIRRKIQEYDINLKEPYFLAVRGVLGSVSPTKYSVYYKVPFKDTEGNVITVDIPKALGEITAYQQKEVIIYGFLKSNIYTNTLSLFIHATRIQPVVEMSQEVKEQEATLMELLSFHQRDIKPFPDLDSYRISVIHGISSDVKSDFERQLKPEQETDIKITYTPINITSADSLKEIIKADKADILVVIRGGGSDGQFEVFNDYELVKEWVSKDAYKIAALGHTRNRTLLDTFASQSCDNPTDAGAFIRKNIDALKALKKLEEAANKHKKEMEEAHKDFENKLQELQKTKDVGIKELTEKLEKALKDSEQSIKDSNAKLENAYKEKEQLSKDIAGKLETKESDIRQLLAGLAKKDSQLKKANVLLAVAVVAIVALLIVLYLR